MIYHRDNNSWVSYSLMGATVVLVLVLVFVTPLPHTLNRFLHTIGGNIWNARTETRDQVADTRSLMLESKASLIEQNNQLQQELTQYKLQAWKLIETERQLNTLRSRLGYVADENFSNVARIIAYPSQSSYDTLVIDQGSNAGITAGQYVYAGDSVLLGYITNVNPQTAVVTLISHPDVESTVRIVEADVVGKTIGRGGGGMVLELPQAINIDEDMYAVHVATGDIVGVVGAVDVDDREPFQDIYLRSLVNIRSIEWVHIK